MEVDEKYMRRALQLALNGAGRVSPNPMVGAVIVHQGRIIGEGWHRRFGSGHAEVNAVASVKDRTLLRDSTIYVTLEPCSHYGKTPPCAKLLVDCGIPRVVVGTVDPFEKVSGRGVRMLREAGCEVVVGCLEQECRALDRRFFTAHTSGMPWVQLKWAQTADGYMAVRQADGSLKSMAISNQMSQMAMHKQRSVADAILVGASTVTCDNPSLNTRRWSGNSPIRVVLDRHLSAPLSSRVYTDGAQTIVYNAVRSGTEGCATLVKLDSTDLHNVMHDLYGRGITSLMVEGGANVLQQFVDQNIWDEVRIEKSPLMAHEILGLAQPLLPAADDSINAHAYDLTKPAVGELEKPVADASTEVYAEGSGQQSQPTGICAPRVAFCNENSTFYGDNVVITGTNHVKRM